ncbi:glycoside hydrolase family 15 protein [Sulfobacillus harzensis]|uniref:Glycoside hydrolase family 15 protein n=1 Tax=Sulfobacillus harzensis TaxID=2729629 RepID=A0A7Y0L3Q1_9FIRM|nr:glycoside hydrolase family 15 protein [Sulfobacillus harzensis]
MREPFYGFLSNRVTSALVSPLGVVDWLPWPRFDGDAAFCRLLDSERGGFLSTLPGTTIHSHYQQYREGTLILETTLSSAEGPVTFTDFLPLGHSAFVRRIQTAIPLILTVRPTFGFGLVRAAVRPTADGAVLSNPAGRDALRVRVRGRLRELAAADMWAVGPGRVDVWVEYLDDDRDIGDGAQGLERVDALEQAQERYWRSYRLNYHGPWQDWFQQSVLVIRALTYRTNGAMLAAATTSLPESIGQTRQWDYRYVWARDGAYGAEAVLLGGDPDACRQFLEFVFNVMAVAGKPYPSPFVRVDGTPAHGERDLLWLAGHRSSRPVRVGNAASRQRQLDIEGEILWVLWRYWRLTGDRSFVRDAWWAVEALADWIATAWSEPDASLWEFRGVTDHFTHSRVMCWVGLQAAESLAYEVMNRPDLVNRWGSAKHCVAAAIWQQQRASGQGYFTQSMKSREVDAALLLLPLYGFVPVDHPVFQRTLERIEHDLVEHDMVFRYRQDNLGRARHPFTLSGFWLSRVYLRKGDMTRADAIFEQQLAWATDLKLFAEHVDPVTGEPRGNFPQLFPHVGLVTTLMERQRLLDGDPIDELGR